jgi:hypothetical protein
MHIILSNLRQKIYNCVLNVKKNKNDALIFIVLLILSLIPFYKSFHSGLINRSDFLLLNYPYENVIHRFLYVWNEFAYLGTDQSLLYTPTIPFYAIFGILHKFGMPVEAINRLQFILPFFLMLLGMYLLFVYIFKDDKYRKLGGVLSASFYGFNYVTTSSLLQGWVTVLFVYSVIPFMLLFWLKGMEEKKNIYIIFAAFLTIFLASSNPTYAGLGYISIFLLTLYYFLTCARADKFFVVQNTLLFVALTLLFNLYWLLPGFESLSTGINSYSGDMNHLNMISQRYPLYGTMHFGFDPVTMKAGIGMLPFNGFFASNYYLILSYTVTIIAFASLLTFRHKKQRRILVFFALLSLVGFFMTKGTIQPLGGIYLWLWNNIPGFSIYRSTDKWLFLAILGISVLLGSSTIYFVSSFVEKLIAQINKREIVVFLSVVIFTCLILTNALPLLSGNLSNWLSPSTVPDSYFTAHDTLLTDSSDYKIIILPGPMWSTNFTWHNSEIKDVFKVISPKPTIERFSPGGFRSFEIICKTYDEISKENLSDANKVKLLSLMNVGDIFVHKDTTPHATPILTTISSIYMDYPEFSVYKIDNAYFLPHIYSVSTPILINGGIDEMFQVVTSDNFTTGDSVLFLSKDINQEQIQLINEYKSTVFIDENASELIFQKINPTKYKVNVNASQPFFLIFSESYHPDWEAYIDKPFTFNKIIANHTNVNVKEAKHENSFTLSDISYLFTKSQNGNNHFIANGYANAWYINPEEYGRGENFTVTLYYKPQSYFYIGLIISGLTLIGCVGYLIWDLRKRGHKNIEGMSIKKGR